jgi:FAD/FMN-containing dehydrogenase
MDSVTRRALVAGVVAGPAALAACGHSIVPAVVPGPLEVDDQSRLNRTLVSRNIRLTDSDDLSDRVAIALAAARAAGSPVCVAGARHCMGGQSLPPERGVAAELAAPAVQVDAVKKTCVVQAGTRWRDVLVALDPHGLSPTVTQSNNDFSLGGTVSVNAHGWATPHGPVGDTVTRFRLMLADGSIVECSPERNADLFGLCIGGYGLFGVLLDIELETADNVWLERTQTRIPAQEFASQFTAAVRTPGVNMAYGRLSPVRDGFLDEALLVTHRPASDPPSPLPALGSAGGADLIGRRLFRSQTGSDAGKRLRWWGETNLVPGQLKPATRNSLMNVSVRTFAGSDPEVTDILHEYFVPPAALDGFLQDCRRIIPASRQDLLNITLRWLEADRRSVLAFAPEPRIALVMLFSQALTPAAETDMRALTVQLIDAVLAAGGSFYLPYRLHARPDQLMRAYPRLPEFVAAKRRLDPELRFQNQMWDRWFARI